MCRMVDANSVHDGGKIEVPHSLDEDGEKINVYLNLNIQTHGGEKNTIHAQQMPLPKLQ